MDTPPVSEARYISCMWFYGHRGGNLLAELSRVEDKWKFALRTRVYVDNKAHDSDDQKNSFSFSADVASLSEDEAREAMGGALNDLSKSVVLPMGECLEYDIIDLQCYEDDPKLYFELASRHWAHVKKLTDQEAQELYPDGIKAIFEADMGKKPPASS